MIAARPSLAKVTTLPARLHSYLGLALAIVLILGAIWVLEGGRADTAAEESITVTLTGGLGGVTPRVGEAAPGFTLEGLSGGPLSLADLRGHPVVINLWASWCPPCRGEMPDLENLAREYRETGLVVLAVNLQDYRSTVERYASTVGLETIAIVLDSEGAVADRYNLTNLPTSYFVDREGNVRDVNLGALTERGLRAKVAKILQ